VETMVEVTFASTYTNVPLKVIVDTGCKKSTLKAPDKFWKNCHGPEGTTTVLGQQKRAVDRQVKLKINSDDLAQPILVEITDSHIDGRDGVIGLDVMKFCFCNLFRGKFLMVVSEDYSI